MAAIYTGNCADCGKSFDDSDHLDRRVSRRHLFTTVPTVRVTLERLRAAMSRTWYASIATKEHAVKTFDELRKP